MDIDIETLDLDDFDINEFINDEEIFNVIYSYPFFSNEEHDYEFRLTIQNDNVTLDELICNDNNDNFDNCVVKTKPINEIVKLIKENKDVRNGKELKINDYIELNVNDKNKEEIIEENKKNVLKDLYLEFMSFYE